MDVNYFLSVMLTSISCSYSPSSSTLRPEPHGRGGGSQPGQADSPLPEQDEEILGSDDDEQEDPNDYCRGRTFLTLLCTSYVRPVCICMPVNKP